MPESPPEQRPALRILATIDRLICRYYHRVQAITPCTLPPTGPAILICNHISSLDPVLIQSTCPRLIVWMMASEYYEIPGLKCIFKQIEAIPVHRAGRDMAATRAALRALQRGRILGIFPEGRIETTDDLLPFHVGAALLAIRANVPLYPAYIAGTQRNKSMARALLCPQRSQLNFGPPVNIPRDSTSKEMLEASTGLMHSALAELRQSVLLSPPLAPSQNRSVSTEKN